MKQFLYIMGLACLFCACQTQTSPREQLLLRLDSLQSKGCLIGHQDDPFYGLGWQYEAGRSDVLESCGDWPAVMGFDLGGIEMADSKNLDSVPFCTMREEIRAHHMRQGIITISWHPRNPLTGGTAWDITNKHVVESILPGGEKHKLFCLWMQRVAEFLLSLTTPDGEKIPLIFRPWHENNGSWFWWGRNLCSAEQYKALWNLMQDYLLEQGLDNLLWAYSPNLEYQLTTESFLERYPRDERVDLIGLDAYQWGTEEDYVLQTNQNLQVMYDFALAHNKPLALTECGLQSVTDPTWWNRVLLPLLHDYPLSYALFWRNSDAKEHYGPVPGTESAKYFQLLYNDKQTLFLYDLQR